MRFVNNAGHEIQRIQLISLKIFCILQEKLDSKKPMTHQKPIISIQNAAKSFGTNVVLKNLDLEVSPGESLVIIGASGSGKSVLLKCMLGLIDLNEGAIHIKGQEVTKFRPAEWDELRPHMGMLFQGGALFDSLKVWENVAFALQQQKKMSKTEARNQAIQTLKSVGLPERSADLQPSELSGGMKKRVGLARAIITNPQILFFDEPTTGLDPIMSTAINNLMKQCVKDLGATAVTITHNLQSVKVIADRVALLHEGRIIWTGSPEDLDRTDNPYVQQFYHGKLEGPMQTETQI